MKGEKCKRKRMAPWRKDLKLAIADMSILCGGDNGRQSGEEGRKEGVDTRKDEVYPAWDHNAPCPRRKGFALPAGSARRRGVRGG